MTPGPRRHDGPTSRARILRLVQQDPGLNMAEVADRLSLSWNTVAYHLRILRQAGRIVVEGKGRDRHLFPSGVGPQDRLRLVLLRKPRGRELLGILLEGQVESIPGLARRLGASKKAVQRQLVELVQAALVERIGAWRPRFRLKAEEARPLRWILHATRAGAEPARQSPTQAPVSQWIDVQTDLVGGPRFGTWEWLPKADQVTMSEAGWRIWGAPGRASGTSQWLLGRVHPEERRVFAALLSKARDEGQPYDRVVRIQVAGADRFLRYRGRVTAVDEDGRPVRIAGTVEEVGSILPSASTDGPPSAAWRFGSPASRGSLASSVERLVRTARPAARQA